MEPTIHDIEYQLLQWAKLTMSAIERGNTDSIVMYTEELHRLAKSLAATKRRASGI